MHGVLDAIAWTRRRRRAPLSRRTGAQAIPPVLLRLVLATLCAALTGTAAQAQIFLSAAGKDTNPCSFAAPCRMLQRGVNATPNNGVLTILTAGEYGPAAITKGITVLAGATGAGVRQFAPGQPGVGSTAIDINAPGQKVALQGLYVSGGTIGQRGLYIHAAASVHLTDLTVERFNGEGLALDSSAGTQLFVADSSFSHNGFAGIYACCGSSKLTVDRSRFEDNGGEGLNIRTGYGSVTRSVSSNNFTTGITVEGGVLNVTDTTLVNNKSRGINVISGQLTVASTVASGSTETGLIIFSGGSAIVTDSLFTYNARGINNQGSLRTRGNNVSANNTNPDVGTAPAPLAAY